LKDLTNNNALNNVSIGSNILNNVSNNSNPVTNNQQGTNHKKTNSKGLIPLLIEFFQEKFNQKKN
jgi:hypothetical protein